MKAILFPAPRQVSLIDDAPIPTLDDGQVLVQCTHLGICGSNRGPYLGEGRWAAGPWPRPAGWLGHENVGLVIESRHSEWPIGRRVLGQSRDYNGFVEFMACRPEVLTSLPEGVDDAGRFVLAQPLATVLHAMDRIGSVIGQRCAVVGQGPIGLMFTYLLRRLGARQVIAIDRVPWRLEWARRLGATDTIDASRDEIIEAVRALTSGAMLDVCVEAVGAAETYHTAAYLPRRRGRLCLFGVPDYDAMPFPWFDTTNNETEIVLARGSGWMALAQTAMDMVASDGSVLADIVTPHMPWAEAASAFEIYAFPEEHKDTLKIVLEM
ncbi:MAG: zinc-binding dehydrogenase [Anaerolineae bacterium]|nr:zinc-binding dehydrogenase [Anaerolineae bacterium]